MKDSIIYIIGILVLALVVLTFRLLGAWLFRINEVIAEMKKSNQHLQQIKNDIDFMRNETASRDDD